MTAGDEEQPPMKIAEFLKLTLEKFTTRFEEEMEWIRDIEKKASSLIAVNGVVLALSAPLFSIILTLFLKVFEDTACLNIGIMVLPVLVVLAYILQLVLFGCSIYFSYKAHRISDYRVPNIDYLIDEYLTGDDETGLPSEIDVLKSCLSEFRDSRTTLIRNREDKASAVKSSQLFFVHGAFTLILIMLLLVILLVLQF